MEFNSGFKGLKVLTDYQNILNDFPDEIREERNV